MKETLTTNDILLSWGYNLPGEYSHITEWATLSKHLPVLDLATGGGRMAHLLSNQGFQVITGDITNKNDLMEESNFRNMTKKGVQFIQLDMSSLCFKSNSFSNIVSANTIHELEKPEIALSEMIRIHKPEGKLLIIDFNPHGFDIIAQAIKIRYGRIHRKGVMPPPKIYSFLAKFYNKVKTINTDLNTGILASNKKV